MHKTTGFCYERPPVLLEGTAEIRQPKHVGAADEQEPGPEYQELTFALWLRLGVQFLPGKYQALGLTAAAAIGAVVAALYGR